MPNLTDRLLKSVGLQRFLPFTPQELMAMSGGGLFAGYIPQTTINNKQEPIGQGFTNIVTQAYAQNPIVFATVNARVQLFSEARFQFQELRAGRPGNLFSTPALGILEEPWPGGNTSTLLKDILLDADLGGNAFILREANGLRRLRPDWVVIIAGNENTDATTWDLDTQVLGYGYQPDGPMGGKPWVYLQRSQVAHFKSTHDPLRRFSGMPWLLPVLREIGADGAATSYKNLFFENAATPNMAVKFDITMDFQKAQQWIELFRKDHEGAANAYKTLFLGGGATMEVIGSNLEQADFSDVQSGGEIRIASAGGVPPIVIGIKGGLDAATYSNYGQARRAFADLTMRPLWRDVAGSLSTIVPAPGGNRLWYDDRDISFLQEDVKDAADIQSAQASTVRTLTDAGFEPETIVAAVVSGDLTKLKHSGLYSVQLQPPGTTTPTPEPAFAPADAAPVPKQLMNSAERNGDIRCPECNRLVAKRTAPGGAFEIKCRGCSALVAA